MWPQRLATTNTCCPSICGPNTGHPNTFAGGTSPPNQSKSGGPNPSLCATDAPASGGAPLPGTPAALECRQRSPSRWLDGAREAGVPIYLAVGVDDPFVSPRHALDAFNVLADPDARIAEDACAGIAATRSLPVGLEDPVRDPLYDRARRRVLLVRRSGPVELRVFDGRHDVVYGADLAWLAERTRS